MEKRDNKEKLSELRRPDNVTPIKKISNAATRLEPVESASMCPVCEVHHQRAGVNTAIIIDCPKWKEMTAVNDRARLVETMNGCKRCLRWEHKAGLDCSTAKGFQAVRERIKKHGKYTCSKELTPGVKCDRDHSAYLCGTIVEYCAVTILHHHPDGVFPDPTKDSIVLLPMQHIELKGSTVVIFYDDRSTACLISYRCAKKLNLVGSPVVYSIQTVQSNGWESHNGLMYGNGNRNGNKHTVTAYGVESIAECRAISIGNGIKQILPNLPKSTWKREAAPVDILLGSNYTYLMPRDKYEVDNLRVKKSMFGDGYMLQGSSPEIDPAPGDSRGPCVGYTSINVHVNAVHVVTAAEPDTFHECEILKIPFLETKADGVNPSPRCLRCKYCV